MTETSCSSCVIAASSVQMSQIFWDISAGTRCLNLGSCMRLQELPCRGYVLCSVILLKPMVINLLALPGCYLWQEQTYVGVFPAAKTSALASKTFTLVNDTLLSFHKKRQGRQQGRHHLHTCLNATGCPQAWPVFCFWAWLSILSSRKLITDSSIHVNQAHLCRALRVYMH